MKVFSELVVNDIYANSYKNKHGDTVDTMNMEIANPDFNSKFDRYLTYTIDNACVTALDLTKSAGKFIGHKCKIVFKINQFQSGTNLVVESLTLLS